MSFRFHCTSEPLLPAPRAFGGQDGAAETLKQETMLTGAAYDMHVGQLLLLHLGMRT